MPTLHRGINLSFQTPADASYFFGYYDKSPICALGKKLLAHRVKFEGRDITSTDYTEVGYFDLSSNDEWNTIGKTEAFNWQQGSMLQWVGPDFKTKVLFNDRENNSFCSRLVDIKSNTSRVVAHPVYCTHPNGKLALSVNAERHYFCRAYHYQGVVNSKWNCPVHDEDGLYQVDLSEGTKKRIVSTRAIAERSTYPITETDFHWLEHLWPNPSGSRFLFMHRWGVGENFKTNLYSADFDGGNIYKYSSDYIYSHLAWKDDKNFTVWTEKQNAMHATRVRAYLQQPWWYKPTRAAYRTIKKICFPVKGRLQGSYLNIIDQSTSINALGSRHLTENGHPSWTSDGRFFLTDTYQDADNYRHLILYDSEKDVSYKLGLFYSRYNDSSFRCDLHPRFSFDNNKIIIDTSSRFPRSMLVFDIDWSQFK